MRFVLIIVVALVAFAAAIIVPLALTGNLSAEALGRLFGGEDEGEPAAPVTDMTGPLIQRLQKEEERLKALADELEAREERLDQREAELARTLEEIQQIQAQLAEAMDTLDAEREAAIADTAKLIGAMAPDTAAESLAIMPPEDAAAILRHVKERDAGKILDAMADKRTRQMILETLQARKY